MKSLPNGNILPKVFHSEEVPVSSMNRHISVGKDKLFLSKLWSLREEDLKDLHQTSPVRKSLGSGEVDLSPLNANNEGSRLFRENAESCGRRRFCG